MNRTLVALTAIAVTVFLVAIFAFAQTVFDGGVTATGAIIGTTITGTTITASTAFAGDLTGNVTGNLEGAVTGKNTGDLDATIAEVDTLKPGSGTAFYLRAADGHDDADLNCADFSGNLTGDVAGDLTGDVNAATVDADTLGITGFADGVGLPNLLSASVHANKFATNAAADTLYWSDGTNWKQLAP